MRRKTKVKRNSKKPKTILRLPDLEHAKSAVLISLTSNEGRDPTVMPLMSSSIGIVQNLPLLSIERWCFDIEATWKRDGVAIVSISDFWIPAR